MNPFLQQPLSALFNAFKKPKATMPQTPNATFTPLSNIPGVASKNDTPDVKASTISSPKYNPTANVINQNALNNFTGQQANTTTTNIPTPPAPVQPIMPATTPAPAPVESEADK